MSAEETAEEAGTRAKILAAACRLFSHQGYENTSLSQVAREAKVSKALIFWHFDTKEKLFKIALRKTLEPYFVSVDEIQGLDEPAQIRMLVDEFYEFVRDNVYSVRFLLSLMLREEKPGEILAHINGLYSVFRKLLTDVIERGQCRGVFRSDSPAALDASLIMATLAGILVQQFMDDEHRCDPKQLLEYLKGSLLQRLTPALA